MGASVSGVSIMMLPIIMGLSFVWEVEVSISACFAYVFGAYCNDARFSFNAKLPYSDMVRHNPPSPPYIPVIHYWKTRLCIDLVYC
jgi:hypothetical protein